MITFHTLRQLLREAVDPLHKAFQATEHRKMEIPDPSKRIDVGWPEPGAHGWMHPDGTYYHISQLPTVKTRHHTSSATDALNHMSGNHKKGSFATFRDGYDNQGDEKLMRQHNAVRVLHWDGALHFENRQSFTPAQIRVIKRHAPNYRTLVINDHEVDPSNKINMGRTLLKFSPK